MKIVLATTIMDNENDKNFNDNSRKIKDLKHELISIANTNKNLQAKIILNKVSDMKNSRHSLLEEAYKYEADMYIILDSDIELPNDNFIEKLLSYKSQYDFVSLYYKLDPPIPAFYTLASSLNDFINYKLNIYSDSQEPFFDDSDFNSSSYSSINSNKVNKGFEDILRGRSFSRDITEFTNVIDENDYTTGGATIYFNRETLMGKYSWESYDNKSLTWYDSYRTAMLSKSFKFAKVPIFLNHHRENKTIQLSWSSVIKYISGLNLYKSKIDFSWNQEAIILHTKELFYYIKGLLKKIDIINITKNESQVIEEIKTFMNIDIIEKLKEDILIWK